MYNTQKRGEQEVLASESVVLRVEYCLEDAPVVRGFRGGCCGLFVPARVSARGALRMPHALVLAVHVVGVPATSLAAVPTASFDAALTALLIVAFTAVRQRIDCLAPVFIACGHNAHSSQASGLRYHTVRRPLSLICSARGLRSTLAAQLVPQSLHVSTSRDREVPIAKL